MEETKFKVGDKVKILDHSKEHQKISGHACYGTFGYLDSVGIISEIRKGPFSEQDHFMVEIAGSVRGCFSYSQMALLIPSASQREADNAKFILSYEGLKLDAFELFATEKELRKRIAELSERTELKRDSIKVHDIKRTRSVTLGVKITLK